MLAITKDARLTRQVAAVLTSLLCLCVTPSDGQQEISYELEEEKPVGTVIGNLRNDAALSNRYDHEVISQLRFRFMTRPNIEIVVDSETGVLRTVGRVDREELCPYLSTCEVTVNVAVQPSKYFQIFKIIIAIHDINDNDPTFTPSPLIVEMSEASLPGNYVTLPVAVDADSPAFGVERYEMVTWTPVFNLQVTQTITSKDIRLVLIGRLDREAVSQYSLRIAAVDGGSPPRSSFLDIQVSDALSSYYNALTQI